jgi:predicted nucleic acid-binding Zn ribbon protein
VSHNATKLTTRRLEELLPKVMNEVQSLYNAKPQVLLDEWPKIVGPEIAKMTKATQFRDGILYVNVTNSTLLSLLSSRHEKEKLLECIRSRVSGSTIRNIVFRIG